MFLSFEDRAAKEERFSVGCACITTAFPSPTPAAAPSAALGSGLLAPLALQVTVQPAAPLVVPAPMLTRCSWSG